MIEVVTVYTPRPNHEKFMDYTPLLLCQKKTVEKFGHRHVVVSDQPYPDLNVLQADLSFPLMVSILKGQIAYLEQWTGDHPVVLADVDCLIGRSLNEAFGDFDIGLTNRDNPKAPINNGAMYIGPGNKKGVLAFFNKALSLCKNHWGGDQEAIAQAAAPVPIGHNTQMRTIDGVNVYIAFMSMARLNVVPRLPGIRHMSNPFVIHFKGTDRKAWMLQYANAFILR